MAGTATVATALVALLWHFTTANLRDLPDDFDALVGEIERAQITDRYGSPLSVTYTNHWNVHDREDIYAMPEFLKTAFVYAEDKRFYEHSGQDWIARTSALFQNLAAMKSVRGASTISEQVVRMIHPRPRTLWSRWMEGWEAERLENRHSKARILEFYLNQVPFAENRRGVAQAARYYFNRDVVTLSRHEVLALAALVRAPSRLDPWHGNVDLLNQAIQRLASRLEGAGELPDHMIDLTRPLKLQRSPPLINASHFVRWVRLQSDHNEPYTETSIDGRLQNRVGALLETRLSRLGHLNVNNAAALVADHQSGHILVWAVAAGDEQTDGYFIDSVRAPRQPGSALKPFLYGLALERGWTAATEIDDSPITTMIGHGLHSYTNYSQTFYGPVTLRQALGNSLNIPAVRTAHFTGVGRYMDTLHQLGLGSLDREQEFYGHGLALGNGEVTLLEMVHAYGALANRGVYRDFAWHLEGPEVSETRRVYSPEIASLIGNILSDPRARRPEFDGGLLDFANETAVKTGTSSDYRDSWAFGFNDRYVAGVWMGNLDQKPMHNVTGSIGPALVLRATFDLLNLGRETQPLWLSPKLEIDQICRREISTLVDESKTCTQYEEYFVAGTVDFDKVALQGTLANTDQRPIKLAQPTDGLHMAMDPRIPADKQAFEFVLQGVQDTDLVEWRFGNGDVVNSSGERYLWPLQPGQHSLRATVSRNGQVVATTAKATFHVF